VSWLWSVICRHLHRSFSLSDAGVGRGERDGGGGGDDDDSDDVNSGGGGGDEMELLLLRLPSAKGAELDLAADVGQALGGGQVIEAVCRYRTPFIAPRPRSPPHVGAPHGLPRAGSGQRPSGRFPSDGRGGVRSVGGVGWPPTRREVEARGDVEITFVGEAMGSVGANAAAAFPLLKLRCPLGHPVHLHSAKCGACVVRWYTLSRKRRQNHCSGLLA
jgi:hypothetical protein